MAIKFCIHMADIHIRTYKMHDVYGEVFQSFLKKARELVEPYEREEVRIVIVGDYVHQKIAISNEQLVLGTWFLRKLEKIAPVVLVAGNHDLLVNNKSRLDSLTPMVQALNDCDIAYYKESACYEDDNVVWCNYSVFEDNARPPIEEARKKYGNDKHYIGLYHAPLVGATTAMGFEFTEGQTIDLFRGCDMVMLGDIHKRACFFLKEEMEISENELAEYEKKGWQRATIN